MALGTRFLPVLVLPEYEMGESIPHYDENRLDRCICGSSIFRNYGEHVVEGIDYIQVCAICGQRLGGVVDPHNMELYYYNDDVDNPFECAPEISDNVIIAFKAIDVPNEEPEALKFAAFLEKIGYSVRLIKPLRVSL
jgi:hypothetical protein